MLCFENNKAQTHRRLSLIYTFIKKEAEAKAPTSRRFMKKEKK
ncbi:hypothetical protein STRMA_1870 [Streptococcus macacae NCTC 11558]|uniref:Uncharacterized protein n=1 Tax=Streptococcus macacae NCTC 11558 TaxID=764298 RepID=G5JWC4_9STRE|nr:hypothetical protein STRMA_1870 [Streptococcus macacae NCTC 11558]